MTDIDKKTGPSGAGAPIPFARALTAAPGELFALLQETRDSQGTLMLMLAATIRARGVDQRKVEWYGRALVGYCLLASILLPVLFLSGSAEFSIDFAGFLLTCASVPAVALGLLLRQHSGLRRAHGIRIGFLQDLLLFLRVCEEHHLTLEPQNVISALERLQRDFMKDVLRETIVDPTTITGAARGSRPAKK